jgi:Ser/Thr protein kinase RdoA (MazF antagonist)
VSETTALPLTSSPLLHTSTIEPADADLGSRSRHIVYSTLAAESIERVIMANYDFDEPISCVLYHRGVNDTYLVSTSTQQLALRLYRSNWRSLDAILAELRAIAYVHSQGAGVTLPIARKDGTLITELRAPEGLRRAVMFHWATGMPPAYTDPVQSMQLGGALAELHIAARHLQADPARPTIDMDYLFNRPIRTVMARPVHMPHAARRVLRLAARIEEDIRLAEASLPGWGFCHGDLWAGNAHVADGRVVMFDFDFCGFGWQLIDLATYSFDARHRGAREESWKSFIAGYLQIRPETTASLRFLGLFAILAGIHAVATMIALSKQMGARVASDESLQPIVSLCETIEAEASEGLYNY